jgi:O-antigen ligase
MGRKNEMKSEETILDYEPIKRPKSLRGELSRIGSKEWKKPAVPAQEKTDIDQSASTGSKGTSNSKTSQLTELAVWPTIWTSKKGHGLTFMMLLVYTGLAYFRPYELSASLAWTMWLPFSLAVAMLALFFPTQFVLEGNLTTLQPKEIKLLLLFGLIALISIPQAIDPGLAWQTFYSLLFKTALVFVVMINVLRSPMRLKTMMLLGIVAGCFMSATALHNFIIGKVVDEATRARVSINNMFGEPNALALHLVIMIPLAVSLSLATSNVLKKAVYAMATLLMVAGVFATFSRGGFLALLAAGIVLVWKLQRRNRVASVVLIVLALIAILVLAPVGYEGRLASIFDSSKDLVGSSAARKELLFRSILVAVTSPFLGVGIGNFSVVSIRGLVSHNSYTQVAAEIGLFALAVYVMFIVVPYRKLKLIQIETSRETTHSLYYYLSIGLQASIIGCVVGTFFLSVPYEGYVYSLIAYAVSLRGLFAMQQSANSAIGNKLGIRPPADDSRAVFASSHDAGS